MNRNKKQKKQKNKLEFSIFKARTEITVFRYL